MFIRVILIQVGLKHAEIQLIPVFKFSIVLAVLLNSIISKVDIGVGSIVTEIVLGCGCP